MIATILRSGIQFFLYGTLVLHPSIDAAPLESLSHSTTSVVPDCKTFSCSQWGGRWDLDVDKYASTNEFSPSYHHAGQWHWVNMVIPVIFFTKATHDGCLYPCRVMQRARRKLMMFFSISLANTAHVMWTWSLSWHIRSLTSHTLKSGLSRHCTRAPNISGWAISPSFVIFFTIVERRIPTVVRTRGAASPRDSKQHTRAYCLTSSGSSP